MIGCAPKKVTDDGEQIQSRETAREMNPAGSFPAPRGICPPGLPNLLLGPWEKAIGSVWDSLGSKTKAFLALREFFRATEICDRFYVHVTFPWVSVATDIGVLYRTVYW